MKIGIIGAGNVALAHLNAIRLGPAVGVAGIYDVLPSRARAVAERYGCSAFERPEQLYDQVDGVIVASPNHTHTMYTLDAMGHGKPVLCEKPMATTLGGARQMAAAAALLPGLSHGVGFNYRYSPAVEQLRELIATDRLGQLHFIDLAFTRDSALTRAAFTWRDSDLGQATSGALGDLGIHLIDLVSFLTGSQLDAGSCRVRLRTNVPLKEGREVRVDDDAYVTGRLLNGTYVNLTASKSVEPGDTGLSMKVIAERAEFSYHSRRGDLYHLRPQARWEASRLRGSPPLPDPPGEVYGWAGTFHAQIQEWAGLVVRQEPRRLLADLGDGLRAQAVLGQLLDRVSQPTLV